MPDKGVRGYLPMGCSMTKNQSLRERYAAHIRDNGMKQTRQRDVILDTFLAKGREREHVSLDELLSQVQQRMAGVGYATVYRTMKLFVDAGVAHERRFRDGQTRYEPADLDDEHHDHIICVDCGFIHEFEDAEIERRQDAAAEALGMRIVSHRLEIYASCLNLEGCEHWEQRHKPNG